MGRRVRTAQEEAAGREATMKKERPHHFQKKGHEVQFAFNQVVVNKLEEARSHLAQAARTIAEGPAKDALEEARAAVKEGRGSLYTTKSL